MRQACLLFERETGLLNPEIEDAVRSLRRTLHRTPELAHQEWETAATIEDALRGLGLDPFRPAPTSVAVVVGPPNAAPRIGFRADLDALSITEANQVPYSSVVPGLMHACGHDGHAAALVGLAQALLDAQLTHSALLVFQQAEESFPSGAPLVLAGISDELRPPEFYGFHLWPQLPAGSLGLRSGSMLGAVAGLTISIAGRTGRAHGTHADEGATDALAAGVELYNELRNRFTFGRKLQPCNSRCLSIGEIQAGHSPNVVARSCKLSGTLRSTSWDIERDAELEIREVANQVADRANCRIDTSLESGIRPPVVNDPNSVARVQDACRRSGIDCLDYPPSPVGVSDDFGWFVDGTPGALVFVGSGSDNFDSDLHTPTFDFDEAVLMNIVAVGVELTRDSAIAADG